HPSSPPFPYTTLFRSQITCLFPGRTRPIPHRPPSRLQNLPLTKNAMFDSSSNIVGLDIGTSKICAVVAELNDTGGLGIIGLGQRSEEHTSELQSRGHL